MKKVQTCILGGGVAGLILGNLMPNSIVIDKNPLGQLRTPFIPGPRVFKKNDTVAQFLFHTYGCNFGEQNIKIGYEDNGEIKDVIGDRFKKEYSLIARGTDKIEPSFLSSGENNIDIFTDGEDDFYTKVFEKLSENIKSNLITDEIIKIDTKNKQIFLKLGEVIEYEKCYSTINLKFLLKVLSLPDDTFKLETDTKHFVQCEYTNPQDIENAKKYHYMYSNGGLWTRKTYFKDYIVYEVSNKAAHLYTSNFENFKKDFLISICDGNFVLNKIFNLPFQITQSLDLQNLQGIELVGRYAQWNHSIKANEIIGRFKEHINLKTVATSYE